MKPSTLLAILNLSSITTARSIEPVRPIRRSTPPGCRALSDDAEFPSEDVWKAALPGIQSRGIFSPARPDYRFTARSKEDVQNAVKFAAQHNVRLTIITSGHDYMGRSDAPSGLSLDVSQLRGARLLPSFTPTLQGVESPGPDETPQVIQTVPGQQAAVTFGAGLVGFQVNGPLNESGLFMLTGSTPSVSTAGGWGQHGGHSLLSPQYGLGVDQFLEFKVVTADGQLRVANKVANPDLFWALRGGGGGNFGVVTEATVKTHRQEPILGHVFIHSALEHNDGLYDSIAYFGSVLPDLINKGMSGYYIPLGTPYICLSLFVGENATEEYAKSVLNPVMEKMASFPGTHQTPAVFFHWANYQELISGVNPWADQKGTGADPNQSMLEGIMKAAMANRTELSDILSGVFNETSNLVDHSSSGAHFLKRDSMYEKRSISFGDYPRPISVGKTPIDSRLLFEDHLRNLPTASMDIRKLFGRFVLLAVAGNKVHRPDDDVSVLPAWRQAYAHMLNFYNPPYLSAQGFRDYAPNTGSYGNEGYYGNPDWKAAFWGENYPKLSEIKTKYDPNMVFWNSPGINADLMKVVDGRLCRCSPTDGVNGTAPMSDNTNGPSIVQNVLSFFYDESA